MGMLDYFNNMTQEQSQGLLAAGNAMTAASAPSNVPVNIMSILGGGMATYNGSMDAAKKRKKQDEEAAQIAQMRSLQMREMQGGLSDRDAARQQAMAMAELQQKFAQGQGGGAATGPAPSPEQGITLGATPMNSSMGQPAPQQQPAQAPQSQYEQMMAYAQFLQKNGRVQEAFRVAKEAEAMRPKLKEQVTRMKDGKPVLVDIFENGDRRMVDDFTPTPKVHWANLNNKIQPIDENTNTPMGNGYNIGRSADSVASNAVTMRGQDMSDRRSRQELAMGGKPPPGYRWSPDGSSLAAIPGGPGDKLPESQQKQVVGVNNLSNAIKEYRSELAGFKTTDALKLDTRATMGTKYNNMMLQAKEAYNLGVLNGPDLSILTSVITDPRSVTGFLTSKKALDSQASELERIMQKVGSVSGQARQPQNQPGKVVNWKDL